jgi:hypothetical protein
VIAILASAFDGPARRLLQDWSAHDARLLCPRDLSRAGWRRTLAPAGAARAVIAGAEIADADVDAVVGRLAWVGPADLDHVAAGDREFVAAEMTAFLRDWLEGLDCPIVNRPGGASLCGPGWSRAHWTAAAAQLGLPVAPYRRRSGGPRGTEPAPALTVTVAGDRCSGTPDPDLAHAAWRLARHADVPALRVRFDGSGRFQGADPWLDLDDASVRAGLLERAA